jgi:hypothetical protein
MSTGNFRTSENENADFSIRKDRKWIYFRESVNGHFDFPEASYIWPVTILGAYKKIDFNNRRFPPLPLLLKNYRKTQDVQSAISTITKGAWPDVFLLSLGRILWDATSLSLGRILPKLLVPGLVWWSWKFSAIKELFKHSSIARKTPMAWNNYDWQLSSWSEQRGKWKRSYLTRSSVAKQPERIGRRDCVQMFSSNQDLQIYQQNQNAKIGFRALLMASNESHHSFWSLSHRLGTNNIVSYKDENVFGNSTGCASKYYKA